jgi:hypothetical protein
MKKGYLMAFVLAITGFFAAPGFCAANLPSGFEVYFNNPDGAQDLNSPGLDFRFKAYLDAASNTTIYACIYDIDNSTAIFALNSALDRGCTVYFICDADAVSTKTVSGLANWNSIKTVNKIRTSAGNEVHDKFCVIEGSSVWTGSWNATDNDTFQNNNNAVVVRSTGIAEIYKKEFGEMYGTPLSSHASRFGSAKQLTSNNGKTESVNGVLVDIYFSPYQSPSNTSDAIGAEILLAAKKVDFCMFQFSDSNLGDDLINVFYNKNVSVAGIVDLGQDSTQFSKLVSTGIPVIADTNRYNLHHKFGVIDPFSSNAVTITGSHNWTATANTDNDENTMIIHSPAVAQAYSDEFDRLYKVIESSRPISKAVENVIVYPSPVKNNSASIGFNLSSNVTSAVVKIYTMSGLLVREIPVSNITSGSNTALWDCTNDSSEKVASGLYIAKVEATTPDGTFFKTEKFAVLKEKN